MYVKLKLSAALSPNSIDMQLPLRLHLLEIVNVPIPFELAGVNSPLKLNVCPLLILSVAVSADKVFQLPSPSTQYSQALTDNDAVNPSSSATIVK